MNNSLLMTSAMVLLLSVTSQNAQANSVNQVSKGVVHSVKGSGKAVSTTVKVSVGAVAIPLISVAAVGEFSAQVVGEVGAGLSQFAFGEPLPIGDEVIVTGPPPKVALAKPDESKKGVQK